MVNNSKRFLSLLLALVMVIALMPVGYASAEENTINMEVGDTYQIPVEEGVTYSVQDETVVKVEEKLVSKKVASAVASNGSSSVPLQLTDCEYVFSDQGLLSSDVVGHAGTKMYIRPISKCHGVNPDPIELEWNDDGSVFIKGDDGDYYLYFDRNSFAIDRTTAITPIGKDFTAQCSFYLYRKAQNGETSSDVIPGYVLLTEEEGLKPESRYLVVFFGNNGNTYCVDNYAPANWSYGQKAQIVTENQTATELTVTALKAGVATVTIDGIDYTINVTDPAAETLEVVLSATAKALPLMNEYTGDIVDLSKCEYVLGGTEGAYSLKNGTIYVDASLDGKPQTETPFEGLKLTFKNDNSGIVYISNGGEHNLKVNNTKGSYFKGSDENTNYHPWWWDNSKWCKDETEEFYLLKKAGDAGYAIAKSVEAGESYLIAFKNTAGEWFVMYPSTYSVSLAAVMFKIAGANMTLGESLDMNFVVNDSDIKGVTGAKAVITKKVAGSDKPLVVTVPRNEWFKSADPRFEGKTFIKMSDLSAKEMTDEMTVVIYNDKGSQISQVWTDSMRDYAIRLFKLEPENADYKAFAANLVNYGAAAQNYFNYNKENLANTNLPEGMAGCATTKTNAIPAQIKGDKFVGATLLLQNRIQLNFVYKTADLENVVSATAVIGEGENTRIISIDKEKFGFVDTNKVYTYIPVEGVAIADCYEPITLTLNGVDYSATTDSVASYCKRVEGDLFTEILELAASAESVLGNN